MPTCSLAVRAGGGGLSGGAIAGIAVGSAAVVVALIALLACCLLGGRRRGGQPPPDVEMLGPKVLEEKVKADSALCPAACPQLTCPPTPRFIKSDALWMPVLVKGNSAIWAW